MQVVMSLVAAALLGAMMVVEKAEAVTVGAADGDAWSHVLAEADALQQAQWRFGACACDGL